MVGEDSRLVLLGRAHVAPHELPGIDGRVGHGECALDARVQPGLAPQRLVDGHFMYRHTGAPAAGQEAVTESGIIPRRRDKKAAGVFDAVGRDFAEDAVLVDAFDRGRWVLDRVASAGVKQAVETACRAVGEVAAFDEHGGETPHRGVTRDAAAGRAAADDKNLRLD